MPSETRWFTKAENTNRSCWSHWQEGFFLYLHCPYLTLTNKSSSTLSIWRWQKISWHTTSTPSSPSPFSIPSCGLLGFLSFPSTLRMGAAGVGACPRRLLWGVRVAVAAGQLSGPILHKGQPSLFQPFFPLLWMLVALSSCQFSETLRNVATF